MDKGQVCVFVCLFVCVCEPGLLFVSRCVCVHVCVFVCEVFTMSSGPSGAWHRLEHPSPDIVRSWGWG